MFRRSGTFALLALLALPAAAAAQDLPPAERLIARYVEAIGGRDAVLGVRSTRTVGTYQIPAAGLTGELEVLTARPNRMVSTVRLAGMGEMRSGFDGTTAWAIDPMMGARVMTGGELTMLKDNAAQLAAVRDASLFTVRETVGRTELGGQPCYRVRLVWNSGRESFDCYHVDSGLLVGVSGRQESPMGAVEVTTRMQDYRQFGRVKYPTRMVQEMMGAQVVMTVDSVEFDTVDDSAFELPAQIRAQVGSPQRVP